MFYCVCPKGKSRVLKDGRVQNEEELYSKIVGQFGITEPGDYEVKTSTTQDGTYIFFAGFKVG